MSTFTMTHELACGCDRFWELFFDRDFTERLYKQDLGFPNWEVVDDKDGDKERVRIVRATPKMEVPGAVAKLIGGGFSYTEEGRFDKATKTFRWNIKPSTLEGKLRNEGTVRCEPVGDSGDRCRRIVDVVLEAKVFGVGGMIESAVEKGLRSGWEKAAERINAEVRA